MESARTLSALKASFRFAAVFFCLLFFTPAFHGRAQDNTPSPETHSDEVVRLAGPWKFHWGDSSRTPTGELDWAASPEKSASWSSVELPARLPGRAGESILWMTHRLPDTLVPDASLFFLAMDSHFEIYLGGKRIYAFGEIEGPARDDFLGYPWFLVPLPPESAGQTVALRIRSTHDNIGPYGDVFIGSRVAQITRIVRYQLHRFLASGAMILLGMASLCFFVRRREDRISLGFALMCFVLGSYTFCRLSIKQVLVDMPRMWFVLELVSFYFMPLGLSQFTDAVFGPNPLTYFTRLTTAYAVVALVLVACGVIPILSTLLPFQLLFLGCLILFAWQLVKRLRRGERESQTLAVGCLLLAGLGLHDLLLAMGLFSSAFEVGHWGMFAFVGSSGVIMLRRVVDVFARLKRMSSDLGGIAVRLGDRLGTPLEIMTLASEEIEDHFEEHIHEEKLRAELAHLFEIFRANTQTIHRELGVLQKFKKFATEDALRTDACVESLLDEKPAAGVPFPATVASK